MFGIVCIINEVTEKYCRLRKVRLTSESFLLGSLPGFVQLGHDSITSSFYKNNENK